jgi:hypothetical protein
MIRFNFDFDFYHTGSMARTNKNITNDSKSHAFDVKKEPLVKIEPDHVVPDELHLLLRISTVRFILRY